MSTDYLAYLISLLNSALKELEKRERKLNRILHRKGYTIKHIKGYSYVYTWWREQGKTKWKCLGRVERINTKALHDVSPILEELTKIEHLKEEVARKLEEVLRLFEF
ncbi:hypothetical protein [Hydrogenobacter hydrogenophilus]|uniref:Uncharacterized protein n=1 Tax=Hydrogenobacter hydrogenophilus TaxID=35835 RepID=A0A285P5Y0_9AQUI|nr:hypothetical protein [Hydrogenobacter hydrogenophilus]SNZ15556.1 hypothetical protein SAMN06265353_1400 [Hydrogenobacter hydrogenophilus]